MILVLSFLSIILLTIKLKIFVGRVKDLRLVLYGTSANPRSAITEDQEKQAREMCGKYKRTYN